MSAYLLAET